MDDSTPKKSRPKPEELEADTDQVALDALEKEASEFNKDAEISRILSSFKLDAYAVLDLQPGVPASQIKATYRKKSLLIHPDKTSNPSAPEAFDRLAKAQSVLLDDKLREPLDQSIADARMLLIRKHRYTLDSPELKTEGFAKEWRKKTVEVLVDEEMRRRRQMKAQLREEGRQREKEEREIEERKRKRDKEKEWEETREERIGSWRDWQKGKKEGGGGAGGGGGGVGGGGEGKKKKKMKVLG